MKTKSLLPYTELKTQSHFSFLRAASSPQALIETALQFGLSGLALTDVGGVYGVPRAYQALKNFREKTPDFTSKKFSFLVGAEILFREASLESAVLIAPTRAAYGALCRLLTESHRLRPKGTGDFSVEEFFHWIQTTPCAENLILFPQWEEPWLSQRHKQSGARFYFQQELKKLRELKNSIYFPLARYRDGFDVERTEFARTVSQEFQWKCVAHQGVLYHHPREQILQDVLTSIRENTALKNLGFKLKRNSERRLRTTREMNQLFSDFPEALIATEEVRSQCTFDLSELKYRYPTEWIPEAYTAQAYLQKLCEEGLKRRYSGRATAGVSDAAPDAVKSQLYHELQLIEELKFADYFLTVYDIVRFARSRNILCQGRGSAANSVVCYLLGITEIDPVQMNLLFERFISVERGEPPDIDVDFEHDRREEVIQYIYEKYGRNRAAMVSALVTYQHRSTIRDVAKAFGVEVGVEKARALEKRLATEVSKPLQEKILEVSERLIGFPRYLSIHSGGFTLSHEPVDTMVPIEPATMEGRTIIQWDKYDLDILGLLKIDVLSLGMLSAIRRALEYSNLSLEKIPHDDAQTYQMIQKADTIGVFQIESRAQMSMLPRLKPKNFYDLVVELALVRPGPISGNMVHPYLKRRNGIEPVQIPDPRLEPILGRTYGVPIFQEQVMKMAVVLAIFTPGEADRLRRAIGAWRSSGSIDEMGKALMRGLIREGLPESFAQQIFAQIQGFAEYGFPESHSASFALLTYASSYLKCHYPAEFLCALLNSQPMGFYSPHSLIDDAKRHGVEVFSPCVQKSEWESTVGEKKTVQLGLGMLHGLEKTAAQKMILQRQERGFQSLQDFYSRTNFSFQGLCKLAMASAFDGLGLNSREALFEILSFHPHLFQEAQESLFAKVALPKLTLTDQVVQDYRSMNLSVRAHPVSLLRAQFNHYAIHSQWVRAHAKHGERVKVMGVSIIVQRPPTAKGTAFATLEDEYGILDLIFHRDFYQRYKDTIREETFLWMIGQVQRDGDAIQIIVKKIESMVKGIPEVKIPIAPGSYVQMHY